MSEEDKDELSLSAVIRRRALDAGKQPAAPKEAPAGQAELKVEEINERKAESTTPAPTPAAPVNADIEPIKSIASPPQPRSDDDEEEAGLPLPFDPFRLGLSLVRVLPIGLLLGTILAIGGYLVADSIFRPSYSAWSQIIKVEIRDMFRTLAVGESFKPKQLSLQTLVNVMVSRPILEKVGAKMNPPLPTSGLRDGLTITPERETDLITIQYASGISPQDTVDILNLYLREVVQMTKEVQTEDANEVNQYLTKQIGDIDNEAKVIGDKILSFSRDENIVDIDREIAAYLGELTSLNLQYETSRVEQETLDIRITSLEKELAKQNPLAEKIRNLKKDLDELLAKYTDENPVVMNQREQIKQLEAELKKQQESPDDSKELQPADTTVGQSLYLDIVKHKSDKESLKVQLEKLSTYREQLQNKLARLPEKGVEYAKLKAREGSLEQTRDMLMARKRETELFLENAPGLYRISTAASIDEVQTFSTGKKKLMAAGAGFGFGVILVCFFGMVIEMLDERIKTAMDLGRVTKLPVSARLVALSKLSRGEQTSWAFRTWTQLSGMLSKPQDFPTVVGFASGEPGEGRSTWIEMLSGIATNRGNKTIIATNRKPEDESEAPLTVALSQALADPAQVMKELSGSAARIHLLIEEGWHWNLENRKAWHSALKEWNQIPGCLVFLELPPAADAEAVLLAEQVTDLFWLAAPTKQRTATTTEQIQVLRDSSVNLVGAVWNKEVSLLRLFFGNRKKLRKLIGAIALGFLTTNASAADANLNYSPTLPNPKPAESSFSYRGRPKLATWQQRLTLGPEDKINIEMYQVPGSQRTEVEIGPDGTLSYYHATSVKAEGLTIDELRNVLTKRMQEQYRNAQVIITPHQFHSKRYYMLGKITEKNSYPLDRPLTIIEAVAQAFGMEIGVFEQNTVELADLNRSFIMREGKKLEVDFYKLFFQGDLSQNILIEPDDYIYIASAIANDFYVLGEVNDPGKVGFLPDSSVITSIIKRGGFTDKAYLKRVLVVRGSMHNPDTFIVDAQKILDGKAVDFRVQPKDIIFVAGKPWQRVSDLLEMATTAFIQASVASWTGANIGPLIKKPVLPSLK